MIGLSEPQPAGIAVAVEALSGGDSIDSADAKKGLPMRRDFVRTCEGA